LGVGTLRSWKTLATLLCWTCEPLRELHTSRPPAATFQCSPQSLDIQTYPHITHRGFLHTQMSINHYDPRYPQRPEVWTQATKLPNCQTPMNAPVPWIAASGSHTSQTAHSLSSHNDTHRRAHCPQT
jgi:hypothetical protein